MRDDPHGSENNRFNPFGGNHRRKANDSNGVRPEGLRASPVPFDEIVADPIDLVSVQADDELINALAAGMAVSAPGIGGYDAEDRVAAMLATWKAEVDAEPIPDLVDIDTATAAVVSGRPPSGRIRHLMPLAGAAALIVFAVAGVSVGAQDARPGDALWVVSKVLYQEHAESVQALGVVTDAREKAVKALAVGDKQGAAVAVEEGKAAASVVLAEDGKGQVVQDLSRLEAEVDETTPGVPNDVEDPARPKPSDRGVDAAPDPPTDEPRARDPRTLVEPSTGMSSTPTPTTVPPPPPPPPATDPGAPATATTATAGGPPAEATAAPATGTAVPAGSGGA